MEIPFKNTDGDSMAAQSGESHADVRFIRLPPDGGPRWRTSRPWECAMFLRRFGLSVAVPAIVVFTSLAVAAAQSDEDAGFVPVTDAMLEDPAPGDWLMWRRTQNGWGYSPLGPGDRRRDNAGDGCNW